MLERFPPGRYLRPFLATGFLGAYTTYSTSFRNALGTLVTCAAAAAAGVALAAL